MTDIHKRPLEIAENIYLIGASELHSKLQCNAYLLIDKEDAIVFDPGSKLDFSYVYHNIEQVIDPKKITCFVLHHQDPDFCSAVPIFESKGIVRPVITHWRTSVLTKYYGIKGDYYLVDQHGYTYTLSSGRILKFILTPYLHFPGAIATYDEVSKTLFSSDLFGAFFINEDLQRVFADENYIEAMKAFHEHFMPGNEFLRPVMEVFLKMEIKRIASQHGSIIIEKIPEHIRALRDLECGSYMRPIRKEIAQSGGYVTICNEVLRRCHAIAGLFETIAVFHGTDIVLDEVTGYVVDFSTSGVQLWHNMFSIIQQRQGMGWISALEVLTRRLAAEYSVPVPDVYQSVIADISRQVENIDKQYKEARELSDRLQKNIEETQEQLLHDTTSGLYNAEFYMQYLLNEFERHTHQPGVFIQISIDSLQRINYRYGYVHGDTTVKSCALLVTEHALESMVIARLEGALFGVYFPGASMLQAEEWAEKFRVQVAKSTVFIEPITVSIALVDVIETPRAAESVSEKIKFLHRTAGIRIRIAKKRGADYVCKSSATSGEEDDEKSGKVLIVDTEQVNCDILTTMLDQMDILVHRAADGEEALAQIDEFTPDIILCEMMLPKIDGFSVREHLVSTSKLKNKPFILMSHVKNDATVLRAHQLGIMHYFKKPYLLSEMIGVIKNVLRSTSVQ